MKACRPHASGENSAESQEAERVQVEPKIQSSAGKQAGKRVDILVLHILFPQTLLFPYTLSQDGVKEGNEGEDGMKNKKESQWRNTIKKEEMRKVKKPRRG